MRTSITRCAGIVLAMTVLGGSATAATRSRVTITRDRAGIPHITAANFRGL
ncbi:MAG: hypothetical protein JOY56_03360, partial [Solirubrobacterales bacterium]|nr:hypothetical protein [Solirubrobacterales bacterium]